MPAFRFSVSYLAGTRGDIELTGIWIALDNQSLCMLFGQCANRVPDQRSTDARANICGINEQRRQLVFALGHEFQRVEPQNQAAINGNEAPVVI